MTGGEKMFDSDFVAWLNAEGFQNGPAERSGGVIIRKARVILMTITGTSIYGPRRGKRREEKRR
jgi:hypothetical protein